MMESNSVAGQVQRTLNSERAGSDDSRGDEISLLTLAIAVLRHRHMVAVCVVGLLAAVALGLLLRPRTFTSSASFMPQTRQASSAMAGFAERFGVSLPTTDPGQGPAFYADLIVSRAVLEPAALARYRLGADTSSGGITLLDAFRIPDDEEPLRREAAIRVLEKAITVQVVQKTGVVTLKVETRSSLLSQQVCQRILDFVNLFNLETRQSQAAAERRFVEQRLGDVRQQLRDAEDRLQEFLQRNRDFRNSPELSFQQDRLAREVVMRQQMYTSLSQAFEQARIDEVRDTPLITVVERPEVAVRPERRGLVSKGIVAAFVGAVLGVGLALVREVLARSREGQDGEYQIFVRLRREAVADLLRPWRIVRARQPR